MAAADFGGRVVLEITTRRAGSRAEREADFADSLEFARTHLGLAAS